MGPVGRCDAGEVYGAAAALVEIEERRPGHEPGHRTFVLGSRLERGHDARREVHETLPVGHPAGRVDHDIVLPGIGSEPGDRHG
jgi:hypothetical protein